MSRHISLACSYGPRRTPWRGMLPSELRHDVQRSQSSRRDFDVLQSHRLGFKRWHGVSMLHWLKVRIPLTYFVQILIVSKSHGFPLSSDWLSRWHPQLHINRFMHYADCQGLI